MSLLFNATLDDFSSLFSYSAGWTAPDTSARGFPNGDAFLQTLVDGTYHQTRELNATTTLSFAGSALYLYGVAGPSQGYYTVTLDDGATSAPVSAHASSNITNHLLWSSESLSAGDHKLQITNLGQSGNSSVGGALLIDYALVSAVGGAQGATLTNTTIENDDRSRLIYQGNWTSNEDERFSGGSSDFTNEELSVSLKFNGSAIYVFGDTVNDHGLFTVDLDGVSRRYQGFTQELKFDTLKFFEAGLNSSEHTVTITNNPGSTSTFFDLDNIIITTPSAYTSASAGSPSSSGSPTAAASGSPAASTSARPTSSAHRGSLVSGLVLLVSVGTALLVST